MRKRFPKTIPILILRAFSPFAAAVGARRCSSCSSAQSGIFSRAGELAEGASKAALICHSRYCRCSLHQGDARFVYPNYCSTENSKSTMAKALDTSYQAFCTTSTQDRQLYSNACSVDMPDQNKVCVVLQNGKDSALSESSGRQVPALCHVSDWQLLCAGSWRGARTLSPRWHRLLDQQCRHLRHPDKANRAVSLMPICARMCVLAGAAHWLGQVCV